jgi:hypothetical protein
MCGCRLACSIYAVRHASRRIDRMAPSAPSGESGEKLEEIPAGEDMPNLSLAPHKKGLLDTSDAP